MERQCKSCVYWKALAGGEARGDAVSNACHYLLDTGRRKQMDGDKCLSMTPRIRKRRKRSFDVPGEQQGL